jgi:acetyl-CoA carboxylase biotin carboxylase subunit
LLDEDDRFYFMEMNTRIQVEHPVTEMVTGIDLVKEQMRIAAGEPLGYTQKDISFTGASIECRINAEDPDTFVPCPGKIRAFHLPGGPGVRVDTASYAECTVPPFYDSLIAKLVVHGRDRKEAIQRMKRALDLTVIEGIKTTLPLHRKILNDDDFVAGRFNTRFLEGLSAEKIVSTP